MCQHRPDCPAADASDHAAAAIICMHAEQGWSLLCNGVLLFDDTGELLPDSQAIAPSRFRQAGPGPEAGYAMSVSAPSRGTAATA